MSSADVPDWIQEYWDWFAVALFVLITVDMITTMYAAWYVGPAGEANPLMRWALGQGMLVLTAVNLVATVLAVGVFYLLMESLKSIEPPYDRYARIGVEAWLGLLISAGLFVFANNLFLIFHGRSLLLFG
ncbi:MAG: DUF5658 family protein [Halobacteriales archaeon]|nr:DUF5658 family protein [Halobacteriales archaeon]